MDNLFTLILSIAAIFAVYVGGYYLYNFMQETITRKVKVVAKRTAITQQMGQSPAQTNYYCTFEFEDGQRSEYSMGAGRYGMIAEGDSGELDTKGALFWDFRRTIA